MTTGANEHQKVADANVVNPIESDTESLCIPGPTKMADGDVPIRVELILVSAPCVDRRVF